MKEYIKFVVMKDINIMGMGLAGAEFMDCMHTQENSNSKEKKMGWIKERIIAEYIKHGNKLDWAGFAEAKIKSELREKIIDLPDWIYRDTYAKIVCKNESEVLDLVEDR